MDEYKRANLAHWNELVPIHEKSAFYDVEGFRAGRNRLNPIELEELGDVAGKSLLHLQCHFGLDTLSWARRGARVTGVDFSDRAVAAATALAAEVGLEAQFVCSDIDDLPNVLSGRYDIVYTSGGVLCWLPDLRRWAQVVVQFLRPGGAFYIREFHPFAQVFDDAEGITELKVRYPYFPSSEPLRFDDEGSYADRSAPVSSRAIYEWPHSIGEVISALAAAGLHIEFLHEFPICSYKLLPFMEPAAGGGWRLREGHGSIPFLYSIRARLQNSETVD